MSSLYPTLEDMKVDQIQKVNLKPNLYSSCFNFVYFLKLETHTASVYSNDSAFVSVL